LSTFAAWEASNLPARTTSPFSPYRISSIGSPQGFRERRRARSVHVLVIDVVDHLPEDVDPEAARRPSLEREIDAGLRSGTGVEGGRRGGRGCERRAPEVGGPALGVAGLPPHPEKEGRAAPLVLDLVREELFDDELHGEEVLLRDVRSGEEPLDEVEDLREGI